MGEQIRFVIQSIFTFTKPFISYLSIFKLVFYLLLLFFPFSHFHFFFFFGLSISFYFIPFSNLIHLPFSYFCFPSTLFIISLCHSPSIYSSFLILFFVYIFFSLFPLLSFQFLPSLFIFSPIILLLSLFRYLFIPFRSSTILFIHCLLGPSSKSLFLSFLRICIYSASHFSSFLFFFF